MIARGMSSVIVIGLLMVAAQAAASPRPPPPTTIPASVAAFVGGYAIGDEAAMSRVAWPVFSLELSRRGVNTLEQRASIRPVGLRFNPQGGARDADGYGHWLYTTRSASGQLSVWRIDSDQRDLVLWVEPVYFFSGCDDHPANDRRQPGGGGSAELRAASPRTMLALHCQSTAEGYYVFESIDGRFLRYLTVNAVGDAFRGRWSFGERQSIVGGDPGAPIRRMSARFKELEDREYAIYYRSLWR